MPTPRHPLRSYIVTLFRRGELVSITEATLICDASRQAVWRWLKAEGIDIEAHRLSFIAKRREIAQRHLDGLGTRQKPTKAQIRKELDRAVKKFNAAQASQGQS